MRRVVARSPLSKAREGGGGGVRVGGIGRKQCMASDWLRTGKKTVESYVVFTAAGKIGVHGPLEDENRK